MKNIFIGGVARSGKTTLSKLIKEKCDYNYIPMDYFASSFKHNLPDTKITSNVLIDKQSSVNLSKFLSRVINIMNQTEFRYIIDSAHIMPKDIIKYIDLDYWEIYYVGFPNITVDDKFKIIKKCEKKEDWTCKRTDEELMDTINGLIELSKEIEKECKELNIPFIDTSYNLDKLYEVGKLIQENNRK